MKALRISPMYKCVGLVDADLMDNGTRHPNLVLLKIAGFLYNNHVRFELITSEDINLSRYTNIFLSRVFSFTALPKFYTQAVGTKDEAKFHVGGTGFYATETSVSEYRKKRTEDMQKLENDAFLNQFPNTYGGGKKRRNRYGKTNAILSSLR